MDTDPNKTNETNENSQHKMLPYGFVKRFVMTSKQKKAWQVIMTLFLVFIIGAGIYGIGYKNGHRSRKRPASINQALPSTVESPFNMIVGKIGDISPGKLIFYSADGEKMDIKIDNQTKITKKGATLSISNLKKDQRAQVLLKNKDAKELEATRVILRD